MYKLATAFVALLSWAFLSCNNIPDNKAGDNTGEQAIQDPLAPSNAVNDQDLKLVAATFTDVDPKLATSVNAIIERYLQIKNSLARDDADAAEEASSAMSEMLKKLDKSLFTAEQKKLYEGIEDDLKEHAEHISKSKIGHQREHFAMMSEDVYDIAKAFGSGRTLYHDFCPMFNEHKGAGWLSEHADIINPYYGSKMPNCGIVEEKIQ
ncbi:DUF3347 domain-containing protein [Flavihumibacter petaseus]|uniref:DUF3347 domain-containing protein n=1 Tax=Flavihumibacter petaseus NBRC 106054 TaxID=1220578 RepID=A0A0E9N6M2_9BACT|nr:DUF3347 domain-containing protein [Flavihumibacter petaseus]GAO45469.1 hypothetical protein FPE01S_05_01640 [Flavihumibacter petaseus NBRC 106054]